MSTQIVNTHEAKSRLSELIREVERGGDVIVARNGHPVAKIIPWPPPRALRVSGSWAHRVDYLTNEVGPDDDIGSLFEESADTDLA
ncbi:MAG: type II toxin-antitoxin system Phd/YefM family antitoxin [Acidimicrobiales bacterium]